MGLQDVHSYDPPGARTVGQRAFLFLAGLAGWHVHVEQDIPSRCVVIGAPHTTNWDFFALLLLKQGTNYPFRWVGKDSAFRGPAGGIFRRLGGIPVNRRSQNNFVQQMVEKFATEESFVLTIAPEGTRDQAGYWHTGFYYIALGAKVPIIMGYVDYEHRVVGLGPSLHPSGHIAQDFEKLAAFYSNMRGKHPDKQCVPRLRPSQVADNDDKVIDES